MRTGSPVFTLGRVAVISLLGLGLVGCSSDNTQAPISSVNDSSNSTMAGGTAPVSSPQNTGSAGSPGVSESVPAQGGGMLVQSPPANMQPVQSAAVSAPASQPAADANVQMKDGHIVYNRSYGNIPKGSYSGQTYTVQHGDTLFYIAWITGNDYRDLAQRNNIAAPYGLTVGQQLQVGNGKGGTITGGNEITAADASSGGITPPAAVAQTKPTTVARQPVITYSEDSGESTGGKMLPSAGAKVATTTAPVTAPTASSSAPGSAPVSAWRWPTEGKVIDNFSASEGGNKGIDIAGTRGQPVYATATGRVVYAGNALRGYGNLIIIKHNDDYLSAYAHNDTMLVREQQQVQAGQKIATMGSTGTSSVRLHFEIRYKGKSVNPLRYLPQR
ncbi:peptidase [Erwinia sp. OLTSP20]|uniref:murein hydrolase activator NlpD n=1 Tax=unclassified Erwinia TaxID=2622719 RepID=UPI000C19C1A3|nr:MULTISPECIES: murein hydrolase activator NlpD [unclassified Erwinia]PIJ50494.1 peptidase [Erwinia sp. OAMSP11]PIJ72588.1 peptidase [Erwinia sp. OLSSP12]PIJ82068.1 peptidase [Erwinia sp. OLCASP19]PIJ84950.1 peptidase [Erwinia sp. OLMTSP26]PIJ86554.1 peptidase [Erwinia sp. OLMDSP33]